MEFCGERHRRDFYDLCGRDVPKSPEFAAAAYLLTADAGLYSRVSGCFDRSWIYFRRAKLHGITPYQHALFSAAEDLYNETEKLTISDIGNREIVDDRLFNLVLKAVEMKRSEYIPPLKSENRFHFGISRELPECRTKRIHKHQRK